MLTKAMVGQREAGPRQVYTCCSTFSLCETDAVDIDPSAVFPAAGELE